VENEMQGSLLVLLNLSLKLFGFNSDSVIMTKSLSTISQCMKHAYVGNANKVSGGCLAMTSLEALMEEKMIAMQIITDDFHEVF
jgi:hypothetical protein